jgi:hypothetical protein
MSERSAGAGEAEAIDEKGVIEESGIIGEKGVVVRA